MFWVGLVVGLFLGGFVGLFVMALATIGSDRSGRRP